MSYTFWQCEHGVDRGDGCRQCKSDKRLRSRISALEAERDRAVQLLRELKTPCGGILIDKVKGMIACGTYDMYCEKCWKRKSFLAIIKEGK